MSEVLTEVVKMDPNFDREQFIKDCQSDIIPNVLEVRNIFIFVGHFNQKLVVSHEFRNEISR